MKLALCVAIFLVAGFYLLGFTASNTPEGQAKSKERMVIDLCWQDYERKSLAPDEKRFIAGTCESLEAKFKAKHGVSP